MNQQNFFELNNILNWILGKAILNRILNESFFLAKFKHWIKSDRVSKNPTISNKNCWSTCLGFPVVLCLSNFTYFYCCVESNLIDSSFWEKVSICQLPYCQWWCDDGPTNLSGVLSRDSEAEVLGSSGLDLGSVLQQPCDSRHTRHAVLVCSANEHTH